MHASRSVSDRAAVDLAVDRRVWIVEDEPAAATLAADLCQQGGAAPTIFRAPLPYLAALRAGEPPAAVILDWRLEHELSAARRPRFSSAAFPSARPTPSSSNR